MAKKVIKNKGGSAKSGKKAAALKQLPAGRVYVNASFNNTIVTLTDLNGATLGWSSAGEIGFKGARKSTPFAAISAVEKVAGKAKNFGISQVEVFIKGPGSGRDAAIRALRSSGLNINMIADVTPVAFGGVRAKNKRRV